MSTEMRPRVTVVVPTRNRAESVARVVDDVLAQDYPAFDVCVVDDHSTDDTITRLASVADPRLRVIRSPGRGANVARNAGAECATGEYLVFLDDDDAVRPGWLAALMDTAARTGADLVSCAIERVDRDWQDPIVEVPEPLGPIFAHLDARFLGGAFAIRASLFHEVGGYPADLPSNQQTGLALCVATRHERDPISTATTPFVGLVWHQRRRGDAGMPVAASFARNRLRGTLALLDRHPDRYARDPRERANYLAAAATCAARIGQYHTARALYWQAFRSNPARRRDLLRIALTFVPPLARRVWPVVWDDAAAPKARLHVVEVVQDIAGAAAVPTRARRETAVLRAAGHDVCIVTNDRAARVDGQRVVPAGPRLPLLRRSSIKPLVLGWAARRIVRSERPDLIVVHHPVPASLVYGPARRAGVPVAVVVHSLVHEERRRQTNPHRRVTTVTACLAERRLRRASRVLPVSDGLTNPLLGLRVPSERITVVHNAVDTDRFRPGDEARDVDVLFVGRLSPEKGPDDLLAACHHLPPATRVMIVGSGRLRGRLESAAAAVAPHVEFTGPLDDDALVACYRRARVVAVPSRSDALPNVALEAMASGVPVVATRVGGMAEVVEDGVTGWLVDPADPHALGDALARALASDLREMGAQARRRALQFGLDAFRCRVLSVLEAVAATPR